MKLHAGLKWGTIFNRIYKSNGRKFYINAYDIIYEMKGDNAVFYGKAFTNTNLTKQSKQDFINSL